MSLKKSFLAVILVCTLTLSFIVSAKYNHMLLVVDERNTTELPQHFRTTSTTLPKEINKKGFVRLHIAGGSQFSKLSLEKILQKLHTNHLTIIDLRQESHGFLNGNAISWYGIHNAENADKKAIQIEKAQTQLLQEIEKMDYAVVYKILSKNTNNDDIDKVKPIEFAVHQVSSEAQVATNNNLNYERIYVQDFHAPRATEVDRFVEVVKQLPRDEWIYFHCRAGKGRSTLFMVMFDMMYNAKNVPLEDILARHVVIGGKDLTKLPKPGTFKYKPASLRLKFIKKFYEYASTNTDNFKTSWSDWVKNNQDLI